MLKIPHTVIVRAPGLLPMLYKVSELATDLDIPERTLRDWLACGAPHKRDQQSHIWINGERFAAWVEEQRAQKKTARLREGEAYCFVCKTPVRISGQKEIPITGKLVHIRGVCPRCGTQVQRGFSNGKS